MQRNPVGWFEIHVADLPRARRFYEEVFDLTLAELPAPVGGPPTEMLAFPMEMDRFGAGGALVKTEGAPSGPGGVLIYFGCADCSVEADRVAAAGGKLTQEKQSIDNYGFMAMFEDPDGNPVGLHSMS